MLARFSRFLLWNNQLDTVSTKAQLRLTDGLKQWETKQLKAIQVSYNSSGLQSTTINFKYLHLLLLAHSYVTCFTCFHWWQCNVRVIHSSPENTWAKADQCPPDTRILASGKDWGDCPNFIRITYKPWKVTATVWTNYKQALWEARASLISYLNPRFTLGTKKHV